MADIGEKIIDLVLAIYILKALEKPATICESTCNVLTLPAKAIDAYASDIIFREFTEFGYVAVTAERAYMEASIYSERIPPGEAEIKAVKSEQ